MDSAGWLACTYIYKQAYYFERDDVDLKGFAKFFRDSAKEEFEHAQKFMKFQTDRGGRIVLQDIRKPEKDEWGTGLDAMEAALALEKTVNQALLDLHTISDKHSDYHVRFMHESHPSSIPISCTDPSIDVGIYRERVSK